MRSPFICCLLLLLSSCVANDALYTASISEKNVYNLSRLYAGMDEFEVLQVMRRPFSEECFQLGTDEYKVWFYVTKVTALGQSRMVPPNLTPLAFRNGTLIGWGYDYYRWMLQKQAEQEDALEDQRNTQHSRKAPTEEDKGIEQALKPTSMSKKPKTEPPPPEPTKNPPEKKKPTLKPEDQEMLEEESEQNFNYW